ncbi:MAG: oxidative damage protection protein [Pseudomonadota bacterium]
MSRLVFCRKYQQELPGMTRPPMPNAKGQAIYETISLKAWEEWQAIQTRLINEKQLNMLEPEARQFVIAEQEKFFNNEDYEDAEGYVPSP